MGKLSVFGGLQSLQNSIHIHKVGNQRIRLFLTMFRRLLLFFHQYSLHRSFSLVLSPSTEIILFIFLSSSPCGFLWFKFRLQFSIFSFLISKGVRQTRWCIYTWPFQFDICTMHVFCRHTKAQQVWQRAATTNPRQMYLGWKAVFPFNGLWRILDDVHHIPHGYIQTNKLILLCVRACVHSASNKVLIVKMSDQILDTFNSDKI